MALGYFARIGEKGTIEQCDLGDRGGVVCRFNPKVQPYRFVSVIFPARLISLFNSYSILKPVTKNFISH